MTALRVEGITAGYGRTTVIRDVSVAVEPGEICAVVGPNGAGKSTLAKGIVGLNSRQGGRVVVDGTDVTDMPPHELPSAGLAYVPQNQNVFPSLTVQENLEMGGYLRPEKVPGRIDEIVALFPDLGLALGKQAKNLSGGQQNMLSLARAIMLEPKAVILDEPTAGLSPAYTNVVWSHIVMTASRGTGILVVEQNVDRALAHASHVHVMVAGATYVNGTADQVGQLDLAKIFLGRDDRKSAVGIRTNTSD